MFGKLRIAQEFAACGFLIKDVARHRPIFVAPQEKDVVALKSLHLVDGCDQHPTLIPVADALTVLRAAPQVVGLANAKGCPCSEGGKGDWVESWT